jgi:hypothetical protein
MIAEDVLITTAEVAIGLAGFSGIVAAVIGSRASVRWSPIQKLRLTELLRTSFGAVVFSLFPLILLSAGVSNSTSWLVASLTWLGYIGVAIALQVPRYRAIWPEAHAETPRTIYFLFTILIATVSLQLFNVVFLRLAWPHLVTMLGSMIVGFIMFVRLLFLLMED